VGLHIAHSRAGGEIAVDLGIRRVANHVPPRCGVIEFLRHEPEHGIAHFDAAAEVAQAGRRGPELEEIRRQDRQASGEVAILDEDLRCVDDTAG
jgi:hypothetical protein